MPPLLLAPLVLGKGSLLTLEVSGVGGGSGEVDTLGEVLVGTVDDTLEEVLLAAVLEAGVDVSRTTTKPAM